jgi:hypothetical protein
MLNMRRCLSFNDPTVLQFRQATEGGPVDYRQNQHDEYRDPHSKKQATRNFQVLHGNQLSRNAGVCSIRRVR